MSKQGSKQGAKQGSKKTQGAAEAVNTVTSANEQLIRIPVSQILVEDGFNAREEGSFVDEELQQLADSMLEAGQMNPIRVVQVPGEEKYVLTDGERRYRAAKLIVKQHPNFTLQAITTDTAHATPLDRITTQYVANGGRPFTDFEKASLISRMKDMGVEPKDISRRLGIHLQMVYNFLKAIEVGEEGMRALREGEVSLTTLTDIARKAQVEAPDDESAKGRGKRGKKVDKTKAKAALKEAVSKAREETKANKEKGKGEKPVKATARHNEQGATRTVQTIVKTLYAKLENKGEEKRNGAEQSAFELFGLILEKASDRKLLDFFKNYE
jgi:ParB/RepB/Spo0J family partition protein